MGFYFPKRIITCASKIILLKLIFRHVKRNIRAMNLEKIWIKLKKYLQCTDNICNDDNRNVLSKLLMNFRLYDKTSMI